MFTLSHEYRTAPSTVRLLLRKVAELKAASEAERDAAIDEVIEAFRPIDEQ